ncbi:MAG: energy transducer TonB [Thermodesulfobacteriota bacterium]
MTSHAVSFYRPEQPLRTWLVYFAASMALHLCVFALIVFAPSGSPPRVELDRADTIDVELVGMQPQPAAPTAESMQTPSPESLASSEKKAESTPRPDQPESPPVKSGVEKQLDPSDYVLETPEQKSAEKAPEKKVKTSMKKQTFQREKAIDQAVRQMAEKSESSRPQSVQNRIEQMKSDVDDLDYASRLKKSDAEQSGDGEGRKQNYSQLQVYQAEVAVEMKNNWAFSEKLAGNTRGLESRLVIKIMPDGSIADVWFEKRSGNDYLDESAYKTVKKSDPLPPLPEGYPYYHLVLGFTPSGLK